MKKKKIVIITLIIVFAISFCYFKIKNSKEENTIQLEAAKNFEEIKEQQPIEKNNTDSIKEDSNISNTTKTDKKSSTKTDTNKKSNLNNRDKSNNSIQNNNQEVDNNTIDIEDNKKNNTENNVQQNNETSIEQPGAIDKNSFGYSFHQGKIEYKTETECINAGDKIALKDTVDIQNYWCIEVVDTLGNIMGYYMYINCSSGNCNKYK